MRTKTKTETEGKVSDQKTGFKQPEPKPKTKEPAAELVSVIALRAETAKAVVGDLKRFGVRLVEKETDKPSRTVRVISPVSFSHRFIAETMLDCAQNKDKVTVILLAHEHPGTFMLFVWRDILAAGDLFKAAGANVFTSKVEAATYLKQ